MTLEFAGAETAELQVSEMWMEQGGGDSWTAPKATVPLKPTTQSGKVGSWAESWQLLQAGTIPVLPVATRNTGVCGLPCPLQKQHQVGAPLTLGYFWSSRSW